MMQKLCKEEAAETVGEGIPPLAPGSPGRVEDSDNKESIVGMPELLKPEDSDSDDSDIEASVVALVKAKEAFHDCKDDVGWSNVEITKQQQVCKKVPDQPKPPIREMWCI